MLNKKLLLSVAASATLFTQAAFAHFQMLYTPNFALEKGETIQLRHIFTHPFSDEHTMDMGNVEEFYVINKEKKTDLKSSLKEITFKGKENSGRAFSSEYKAQKMGDHIFVLTPAPYFEKNEDIYIQ